MQSDYLTEFGDFFSNKRILVTGATGFVGFHLCRLLMDLNADVIGTALDGNLHQDIKRLPLTLIDFRDHDNLESYIHNVHPDYVFHLASLVNTSQDNGLVLPTLQHNLVSTVNLMLSLVKNPVKKVIIVSSSETPLASETPGSPYAASKEAVNSYSKMFAALYGLPISIAKLFTCFGPLQQRDKLIPYIIGSAIQGVIPRISTPKKVLDFIFVKDFARGLLLAAKSNFAKGEILDFGSGKGVQIDHIVKLIQSLCCKHNPVNSQPIYSNEDAKGKLANIKDTYHATGWVPAWTLEEALNETISWYQNQGK